MDSSSKSQPDPKLSPLTVPVAYTHSLPRIGYYPPFSSFFPHCESDGAMIAAPLPISVGDEICWDSPRPSCYPTIPGCTPHELPSSEEEEGADDSPVFLTDKELWRAFYEAGTEMIVNKGGRRLFPIVEVTITGLIPSVMYNVKAKFVCADKYRHRFFNGAWNQTGESEIIHDESRMEFVHPLSPANGEMWMKKPVSFKAIKLTHRENSKGGNILLHTMHKYNINIIIQPLDSSMEEMVYPLANSTFTAVSSYQSSKVTDLKTEHNPFARAFRNRERFIVPSNPVCPPMLSAIPAPGLATPFPVIQPIFTGFVPPDQRSSQPEIKDPETPFPVNIQPIITGFVPPRPEIKDPETPSPTIQPILTGLPYQRQSQPESKDLETPFPTIQPILTGLPYQRQSQPESKDLETPFPTIQPTLTGLPYQRPPRPEIKDPETPSPTIQPVFTEFVPHYQSPSQPEIIDPEIPFPAIQPIFTGFVPPDQRPPPPKIKDLETPSPTIQPIFTGFVPPYQRPSQPEIKDSETPFPTIQPIQGLYPHIKDHHDLKWL